MANPPALVILHGWGRGDLNKWQPAKKALEQAGFPVFLPALPGFFDTPAPQTAWHLSDYADFVTRYITSRKLIHPIILGHSFGGSIALKLALLQPDLIKGLILVNNSGLRGHPTLKTYLFLGLAKLGKLLFFIPPLILFRPLARWLLYHLVGEKDYFLAHGVMRTTLKHILAEDLTPYVSGIKLPTLIIWGAQDKVTPLALGRYLHRLLPQSHLEVVASASHGLPFQKPQLLARLVTKFTLNL